MVLVTATRGTLCVDCCSYCRLVSPRKTKNNNVRENRENITEIQGSNVGFARFVRQGLFLCSYWIFSIRWTSSVRMFTEYIVLKHGNIMIDYSLVYANWLEEYTPVVDFVSGEQRYCREISRRPEGIQHNSIVVLFYLVSKIVHRHRFKCSPRDRPNFYFCHFKSNNERSVLINRTVRIKSLFRCRLKL